MSTGRRFLVHHRDVRRFAVERDGVVTLGGVVLRRVGEFYVEPGGQRWAPVVDRDVERIVARSIARKRTAGSDDRPDARGG